MTENQSRKKDKNQHIQVFVRVRPSNDAETLGRSATVVEVVSPKEVIVRERPHDKSTKKFTFDRVFGPTSKQLDVYTSVVSPLLDEVLAGYNCTIFAYGQTGTGKTYTMEGIDNDPSLHWRSDSFAGIIPRSLSHLFDELRMLENQEYTVRVSYLELYNEELLDLLSSTDEASKIRIYEDTGKKGTIIIHGLEEVTVHNKSEVYKILEKGSEKRKTSATLMNSQSSRSHTVFSITIHIRENTVEGEELLKVGKLNLVDLAGSENVGRSGAVKRRAIEAGNINQSLLTLGRVITALVERAPHIPYRESKLTRLLQESLGGRTKTSIIATVSSSSINLDETLSTLDYAHRAKNITNRPEINQKLSKRALLKEYTEEMERLRKDLQATRERNGVYLAEDNYTEMRTTIDFQRKEIEEKINHIKLLEETMVNKEKIMHELKIDLDNTKKQVKIANQLKNEQHHLVQTHLMTEKELFSQATELLNVVQVATNDTYQLHEKIERKKRIEEENISIGKIFKGNITSQFDDIQHDLSNYSQGIAHFFQSAEEHLVNLTAANSKEIEKSISFISTNLLQYEQVQNRNLDEHVNSSFFKYQKWLTESIKNMANLTQDQIKTFQNFFTDFSLEIAKLVKTNVAESLKQIDMDCSERLNSLKNLMKTTIHELSTKLLVDRLRLETKISAISQSLNENIIKQDEIENKKEEVQKKINALTAEYSNLNLEAIQVKKSIVNESNRSIEVYKNLQTEIDQTYLNQAGLNKWMDETVFPTIGNVQQKLSCGLKQNCMIAEDSTRLSNKAIEKMKEKVNQNCDILEKSEGKFHSRTIEFKKQLERDKSSILCSTSSINKLVMDASINHEEVMEKHKNTIESRSEEISKKFEDQLSETAKWSNRIDLSLQTAKQQINKFFVEDLQKDQQTGSTPEKKNLRFSSQLAATSPHEEIIRKYRQQQAKEKTAMTSDESHDVVLNIENSVDHNNQPESSLTSTPHGFHPCKSIVKANTCERKSKKALSSGNDIIKAASTSDLRLHFPKHDNNIIFRSTSDMITQKRQNKENIIKDVDDLAKPKLKILKNLTSKLVFPKRILISRNNT